MNERVISRIATDLGLDPERVQATASLLSGGATVPFIAHYRKAQTGNLPEAAILDIRDRLEEASALERRRQSVLQSLQDRKLLTNALRDQIDAAEDRNELEDLYFPFRRRKRSRANVARDAGLEPLAEKLYAQDDPDFNPEEAAAEYVNEEKGVKTAEEALAGARDIVAERISAELSVRRGLRKLYAERGDFVCQVVPGREEAGKKFKPYFDWREAIRRAPSHRVLAMRRGEKEGILQLRVEVPEEQALKIVEGNTVRGETAAAEQVRLAAQDAFGRLLDPSLAVEMRIATKDYADEDAVRVFAENLRQLLLTPPLRQRKVLAVDSNGKGTWRLACLDTDGTVLHHEIIGRRERKRRKPAKASQKQAEKAEAAEKSEGEEQTAAKVVAPEAPAQPHAAAESAIESAGESATEAAEPEASVAPHADEGTDQSPAPDAMQESSAESADKAEAPPEAAPESAAPEASPQEGAQSGASEEDAAAPSGSAAAGQGNANPDNAGSEQDAQKQETSEDAHQPAAEASETSSEEQPAADAEAQPEAEAEDASAAPEEASGQDADSEAEEAPATPPVDPAERINALCAEYGIQAVAVGSGPGSRETAAFLRKLELPDEPPVVMVNDSGAVAYATSRQAREEMPDLDPASRRTISIGRRLIDPLREMVKIDPRAIGVGQYQHDVEPKLLKRRLGDTICSCVCQVGVPLNDADASLLRYVAGFGGKVAAQIIAYRKEHGALPTLETLKSIPDFPERSFQQGAGFLLIKDGDNRLDGTFIHPEQYPLMEQIAQDLGCTVNDLVDENWRKRIDLDRYRESTDIETLMEILQQLQNPGADPRPDFQPTSFTAGVKSIDDLEKGKTLKGVVTNVTNFGAFVDVGIDQDGLVHVSQVSDEFVRDPNDAVHVGQTVEVTVLNVDLERKRISLSMRSDPFARPGREGRGPRRETEPKREQPYPAGAPAPQTRTGQPGAPARGGRPPARGAEAGSGRGGGRRGEEGGRGGRAERAPRREERGGRPGRGRRERREGAGRRESTGDDRPVGEGLMAKLLKDWEDKLPKEETGGEPKAPEESAEQAEAKPSEEQESEG